MSTHVRIILDYHFKDASYTHYLIEAEESYKEEIPELEKLTIEIEVDINRTPPRLTSIEFNDDYTECKIIAYENIYFVKNKPTDLPDPIALYARIKKLVAQAKKKYAEK